jgi:hypothetical protein
LDPRVDESNELERRLRAAADTGDWLDVSDSPDKDIPAQLLYTLLVEDAPPTRLRSVKVRGARILGPLDLEAATLRRPLHLAHCEIGEEMTLSEAIAPAIRLRTCTLTWLSADQLETRGDLDLTATRITGEVRLVNAHIGGQLDFSGAQLTSDDGLALNAAGLHVDANLFCQPAAEQPFTAAGEIRLRGAHIGGSLSFSGARLTNHDGPALNADGLHVDADMFCQAAAEQPFAATGEIRLRDARVGGSLSFSGARLANQGGLALNAAGLHVDADMFCQAVGKLPFTATGEVSLLGAHIGRELSFSGAQLTTEHGSALTADGLRVDADMFCQVLNEQRFTAIGEVSLLGAHIGGGLSFTGAQLTNEDGPALNADGLRVDADMFCQAAEKQPFAATGEIRLLDAHIGGSLSFSGAQLTNEDGRALSADRLQVDANMFCQVVHGQPFTTGSEVRLDGARIRGQLGFDGAHLTRSPIAISLFEAEMASLWLHFAEAPDGIVDLQRAQANRIYDQAYGDGTWPRTRLEGCRYEGLTASPPVDVRTRLRWVRDDSGEYAPQPYEQLRDVLRRAGHEEDARRVAIAKQRHRRETLAPPAKAWSYILDATVGYGYRTWRALAALLVIIGIGWLVFAEASWDHLTAIKTQRPQFEPWLYSIDAVLPVINLGQESAWAPTGLFYELWYVLSVIAGWLLGLGLVAALTAALFRE